MRRMQEACPASRRALVVAGLGIAGLVSIAIAGCGTGKESSEPTAPKVTRPYDVRGEQQSAAPGGKTPSAIQLATATEPVTPGGGAARNANAAAPQPTTSPIEPYEQWDMPETAAKALGRIGQAAVPQLSQALDDPNPLVRRRAAEILARIGPDAKDAVPALIRALGDRDEEVRKAATRALGEIGPGAADAVPVLIEVLREPSRIDSNSEAAR